MKNLKKLVFIALLLAISGSLVACGNSSIDPEPSSGNSSSNSEPPSETSSNNPDPPGGPYHYKGGVEKVLDFAWYKDHNLTFSTSAPLKMDLLRDSINNNRLRRFGNQVQRYNYVIREDPTDVIYVGVWEIPDDSGATLRDLVTVPNTCKSGRQDGFSFPDNMMINFYQEEPFPRHQKESPCWLNLPSDKDVGLLDAMTKHFMLVQPSATIDNFNLVNSLDWVRAKVSYAGELIVLVDVESDKCMLIVTNGSGTYLPDGSSENLQKVAEIFGEVPVNIMPAYVLDTKEKRLEVVSEDKANLFDCFN